VTVHREQSLKREKTNKMQQSEVDNKHLIVASCWFFSLFKLYVIQFKKKTLFWKMFLHQNTNCNNKSFFIFGAFL